MKVPERALAERVARLSLEEKVHLLTGADFWTVDPQPAVGLRRLVLSDGPVGVRGQTWDDRDPSANLPSPTAVAASWDPALARRLGRLMAAEAYRKGVDVVLAPTVNLHRTPVGGRHFECWSEDPLLTGTLAAAFVDGLQENGIGACVKHVVANDAECERMSVDNRVDERTLHEVYLAPFRIVEQLAGPWSWMAAYNGVNGTTMTEHPLLDEVVKGDWGSDALVVSDWYATRSTVATANAGLDLAMPGPFSPWGTALVDAVRSGQVDERRVDDKVRRLLRLAARTGALELDGLPARPEPLSLADAEVDALTREAAAAGTVLVRNEGGLLPLDPAALTSLAVVGPNALRGRTLGGGSATVFPAHVVHPVDGIASAAPGVRVLHALGVSSTDRVPAFDAGFSFPDGLARDGSTEGVEVTFLDAGGTVLGVEHRRIGAFTWLGSFGPDVDTAAVHRIRVGGVYTPPVDGTYRLGGSGLGAFTVAVDGSVVAEGTTTMREGADVVEGLMTPPQLLAEVDLTAGRPVPVELDFVPTVDDTLPGAVLQLNVGLPRRSDDDELAAAVTLARACDAAVVVVGTTEEVESEGFDRTSLALPGRQDELVRAVAAANPDTVVVVNAGAPVLMPWLDEVRAVLLMWFPGQQMGAALADVLLGAREPGGRMPTTWPGATVVAPQNVPVDGVVEYAEGLHVGHRAYLRDGVTPAVPFGHGLGWTTFDLDAPVATDGGVRVRVTNTGARQGSTVVQVYLSRPGSAVERPVRWLGGYARVELAVGASTEVDVAVPRAALEHYDVASGTHVVEPGAFTASVGFSVADLRGSVTLER